jgi:hypothetical protein
LSGQTKETSMNFHLDKVEDLTGFALENGKRGDTIKVLTRASLTSANPEFYHYAEQTANIFLNRIHIPADLVHRLLVIIHQDLTADLYINDFPVALEIRAKRAVEKGQIVTQGDIADIGIISFPEINLLETDKVIYCFKVGWRFGLFFDLAPRIQPSGTPAYPVQVEKFDPERMMRSIGDLYRYLSFYHVYSVLESGAQFKEMMHDGWFPFIEILGNEYKKLDEAYRDKPNRERRIKAIVDEFSEDRINKITCKWWKNQAFSEKRDLIEAGINAYLQDTRDGFVNCIKNLWTEVEGVLRKIYRTDKGKNKVNQDRLISHIIEKARKKTRSDYSLLLPAPFLKYLQSVAFVSFDSRTGSVNLSRHTSSHGIADAQQYTKDRALQLILILDQIYFYC